VLARFSTGHLPVPRSFIRAIVLLPFIVPTAPPRNRVLVDLRFQVLGVSWTLAKMADDRYIDFLGEPARAASRLTAANICGAVPFVAFPAGGLQDHPAVPVRGIPRSRRDAWQQFWNVTLRASAIFAG